MMQDVEDFLIRRWGSPIRRATFRSQNLSVQILKWDAKQSKEGVTLYASAGASNYSVPGLPATHRIEYIVGLMPELDDIASPLAALALYPVREAVALGHGHTVPLERPIWNESSMNSFLLIKSDPSFISTIAIPGMHIEFLQVVPIFESEKIYKNKTGVDGLIME